MKTEIDEILDMVNICPLNIKFIGETLGRDENHIEDLARILEKHKLVRLNYPIVGNPFLTKIKGHDNNGKKLINQQSDFIIPYTIPFIAAPVVIQKNNNGKKIVPYTLPFIIDVQKPDNNGKKVKKESSDIVPYMLPVLTVQKPEDNGKKIVQQKLNNIVPHTAPVVEAENDNKNEVKNEAEKEVKEGENEVKNEVENEAEKEVKNEVKDEVKNEFSTVPYSIPF